ncbi:Protein kinase-like domain [Pseudocohnilembus persalinus]|uniref:Protein kinase-like domain n=1 Tax=Pseudocohnilembus persalinus TaxID=266149 RepID=A0A0V0QAR0_PSEPJ|nr:Protein kinase-like domain [Pseudocohnilembus persalinus]|eukprot:KRW99265.1 Protein kinase-like domain [Pseudocohnilembus persalinus]
MRKQAQHAEQFNKKIVNGYQFLSVLGKGSFGEVYKASKQNSIYAIKLIEKELVKRKKLEQYVDNEIKIMKELNSQYIVKLHDTFQDKEFLYIVMEFCNEAESFS